VVGGRGVATSGGWIPPVSTVTPPAPLVWPEGDDDNDDDDDIEENEEEEEEEEEEEGDGLGLGSVKTPCETVGNGLGAAARCAVVKIPAIACRRPH
jgi:hypothetical protein